VGIIRDMFVGGVIALLKLTRAQSEYAKWRLTGEGRKYFSAVEQRRFWEALKRGDSAVIDSNIRQRQSCIDKLRRDTGIALMLLSLILPGCATRTIPEGLPTVSEHSLTSGERTYAVNDMELRVPGEGKRTLFGQWHVISPDMLKMHVRNQDDLIEALELVQAERKLRKRQGWIGAAVLLVGLVLLSVRRR